MDAVMWEFQNLLSLLWLSRIAKTTSICILSLLFSAQKRQWATHRRAEIEQRINRNAEKKYEKLKFVFRIVRLRLFLAKTKPRTNRHTHLHIFDTHSHTHNYHEYGAHIAQSRHLITQMPSNLIYQYFHWIAIHVSSAVKQSLVLHIWASHFIIFEWKIHFVVVCNSNQYFTKLFLFYLFIFLLNFDGFYVSHTATVCLAGRTVSNRWENTHDSLGESERNVRHSPIRFAHERKINVSLTKKHDTTDNCCYTPNNMGNESRLIILCKNVRKLLYCAVIVLYSVLFIHTDSNTSI